MTIRGSDIVGGASPSINATLPLELPASPVGTATLTGCAQFIVATGVWDSTGCRLGTVGASSVECICTPLSSTVSPDLPSAPASTSGNVNLGLLFGVQIPEVRLRPSSLVPGAAPSESLASNDVGNSVLGPAIGGALGGVALIAIAVSVAYFARKRMVDAKAQKQLQDALARGNGTQPSPTQ